MRMLLAGLLATLSLSAFASIGDFQQAACDILKTIQPGEYQSSVTLKGLSKKTINYLTAEERLAHQERVVRLREATLLSCKSSLITEREMGIIADAAGEESTIARNDDEASALFALSDKYADFVLSKFK